MGSNQKREIILKYIKKKDIVNGAKYWARLPHNMPTGALQEILVKSVSKFTITVDLANMESPYRNIATYQYSSIDVVERIL